MTSPDFERGVIWDMNRREIHVWQMRMWTLWRFDVSRPITGGKCMASDSWAPALRRHMETYRVDLIKRLGPRLVQAAPAPVEPPTSVKSDGSLSFESDRVLGVTDESLLSPDKLTEILGVLDERVSAFAKMLERKRASLGDGGFQELKDVPKNRHKYVYRLGSVRDLAVPYRTTTRRSTKRRSNVGRTIL
jgi:hypothetical protein